MVASISKLLDFGFQHIDIWRSEPMSLAQVGLPYLDIYAFGVFQCSIMLFTLMVVVSCQRVQTRSHHNQRTLMLLRRS